MRRTSRSPIRAMTRARLPRSASRWRARSPFLGARRRARRAGEPRAARARRQAGGAAATGSRRRPAPRGRLPAVGAAPRRAWAIAEGGGKAILLLNRRGVAPALHCRACGSTLRCTNCDVALVLHADRSLRCHHCGHAEGEPETCPVCRSSELARLGAGTQRLERELAAKLPELEVIRLDGDAAERPGVMALRQPSASREHRVVLVDAKWLRAAIAPGRSAASPSRRITSNSGSFAASSRSSAGCPRRDAPARSSDTRDMSRARPPRGRSGDSEVNGRRAARARRRSFVQRSVDPHARQWQCRRDAAPIQEKDGLPPPSAIAPSSARSGADSG